MSTFAAWLLTYAFHSTLLLGLAWALARPLGGRSPRLAEMAWRAALLGPVLTATLHVAAAGAGWTPALGSWQISSGSPGSGPAAVSLPAGEPASPTAPARPAAAARLAPRAALVAGSAPGAVHSGAAAVAATPPSGSASGAAEGRLLPGFLALLSLLWGAGALALVMRFGLAHLGLRKRLRPRLEISGGTLFRLLARLAPASGLARPVELTCAYRLPVPVALGLRRPEICVPPRALSHLDAAAQETLLAHELGHLARRDPLWLNAVSLLCCALFFQPLNWLARRRLRELSELLCDDWAVRRTGQPLTLARCLAEVAGWSHALGGALLPAPGMADRPSQLARRVRRLLDAPAGPAAERAVPRWLGAALVILLVAVAAVAPGVSAAAREEAGRPAAAAETETAPAPRARPSAPAPAAAPPRGLSAEDRERIRAFRERVEEMAERGELSGEELEREADALAADLERELQPHVEAMAERARAWAEEGDFERLEAEAEALAERLAPLTADLERLVPSDAELERMIPSDEELERMIPSEEELRRMIPSDAELERMIPSEEELERMIPSDAELERIVTEALARSSSDLDRLVEVTRQLEARGGLSDEEVDRLRKDALRLRETVRRDPKTQAELRRVAEEMRKLRRHEVERLRDDLQERSKTLSDEIRRELEIELGPVLAPPPPAPAPPPPAAGPGPGPRPMPAPPAPAPAPPAPSARRAPRPAPAPGAPAVLAPAPAPPALPAPRVAAAAAPPAPPSARPAVPPAPAVAPAPPAPPAPAPPPAVEEGSGEAGSPREEESRKQR